MGDKFDWSKIPTNNVSAAETKDADQRPQNRLGGQKVRVLRPPAHKPTNVALFVESRERGLCRRPIQATLTPNSSSSNVGCVIQARDGSSSRRINVKLDAGESPSLSTLFKNLDRGLEDYKRNHSQHMVLFIKVVEQYDTIDTGKLDKFVKGEFRFQNPLGMYQCFRRIIGGASFSNQYLTFINSITNAEVSRRIFQTLAQDRKSVETLVTDNESGYLDPKAVFFMRVGAERDVIAAVLEAEDERLSIDPDSKYFDKAVVKALRAYIRNPDFLMAADAFKREIAHCALTNTSNFEKKDFGKEIRKKLSEIVGSSLREGEEKKIFDLILEVACWGHELGVDGIEDRIIELARFLVATAYPDDGGQG